MDLDLSMAPQARKPEDAQAPALDLSMAPAAAGTGRPDYLFQPSLEPTARRSALPDIFTREVDIAGFTPRASADVLNSGGPGTLVLERALMRNSQPSAPYVQPEEETSLDRLVKVMGNDSDFAEHTDFGGALGSVAKQAIRAVPGMAKSTNEALALGAGVLDSTERGLGKVLGTGSTGVFGVARNWLLSQSEALRKDILADPSLNLPKGLQGRLWENPQYLLNPEWLAFNTGDAAVSMAPMIAATVMSGGSTLVGAVVGAAQEAGDLYRELIMEDKADPDRALSASLVFGVAVSALNKLGLDKIMDRRVASTVFARAAKAAVAGTTEAVTEWMEEPIQAALQGMANNESAQQVQSRILDALKNVDVMPGAFLLGAGGHHVNQRAEQAKAKREAGAQQPKAETAQAQQPGAEAQPQQPGQGVQQQEPAQPAGQGQQAQPQEQDLPSGADVLPSTREDAHADITRHYGEEQAAPVIALWDAVADSWAERTGSTREAFYEQHIAGILSPPGHVTPEAKADYRPDPQTKDPQAGMDAEALRQSIAPIQDAAANALPLDIVQGVHELPAHLRADAEQGGGTPSAVFDPATRRVYLLADAIGSAEQAVGLWMHEQGAHVGLRGLLGDGLDSYLDRVAEHVGEARLKQLADLHGLNLGLEADRRHAAEEHLASLAERIGTGKELTEEERGLWDDLVALVREWLKSVGVVNAEAVSDAEIARTVRAAIAWVREGKAEARANAKFETAQLRQMFQDTLPTNTAWRIKSYLLHGTDPQGEFGPRNRPSRSSKDFKPGLGLNYDSAVYTFGKEALEGIQFGLVKKGSPVTVDSLMHDWGLDSADTILDALHFTKGKAEAKFVQGGGKMLFQSATSGLPTPLHEVTDQRKMKALALRMQREGWQGRPVVAIDDQAITGTHRLAAAEMAGIDPEVHVIESGKYDSDKQEEADAWIALVDAYRDDERVDAAKALLDMGLINQVDFDLIEQELDTHIDDSWVDTELERATVGGKGMLYQGAIMDKAREMGRKITEEMKAWGAKVDQFLSPDPAKKAASGSLLRFGTTPEVLKALGAADLPVTMNQRVLAKIMGTGKGEHGLPADVVKRLPAMLAEPVAVFRSGTVAGSFVVLTDAVDRAGDPVLVAVHLNVKQGGIEVNDIASAYGKQNFKGWAAKQVGDRNVLYLDKKKAAAVQVSGGLQLPKALNSGGAKKILTAADIVKPVFDAEDKTLNQDSAPGESKFSDRAAREAGPRAGIQFLDDGRAIIHLFQTADASSVIHETGHILRRMLPQADQAIIEKWCGVKDGAWTREAEEKFAKGFEVYVYEGKAPTSRLRRAFQTLRNMLVRIYGSIKNIGGVQITPEVRQVFDHLVSTQAEREAEAQAADAAHSFHVDPEAGLPGYEEPLPASFKDIKEYEDLMAEAERLAYERFDKERRKEHRALRAEWRREARDVVDSFLPHQAMDAAIAQGGLDHEMVSESYDAEFVRLLTQKRPGLVRRGSGVSPDAVAQEHGYTDAHSMMEDFLDVPAKGQIIADYMSHREEAYQRQRALDKDFGGDYMAVQDAALEILGRLTKVQNLRVETAQARATVDELRMYDLGKLRAQARAERTRLQDQAKAAFDAGDPRRAQLLLTDMRQNDLLLREMERALAEREKMERSARTMLSRRIDEDWRQQARNWAGLFGLGGAKVDGLGPELLDYLAAKGLHHFVDQEAIASLSRAPRGALSVDQYRDAHRVLRQIIHFGTWDTRIMGQQKAQQFDAVMGEVLSTILSKGPASPGVNIHPDPLHDMRRSSMGKFMDAVSAYHAELLKPEHIFRQLDGQADMGPVWSACFKPMADSRGDFLLLGEQVQAKLQAAFAPVHKELAAWRKKFITIPEVPRNVIMRMGRQPEIKQGAPLQMTMEKIVMVGLNSGNEGNRQALKAGFQWTEGDLAAILSHLGEREWAVVHQVWDAIEAIYPHLNRAHKRLTGVELKKVQALPFVATTQSGQQVEVRGGYFPLIFDRELNWKADRQQVQAEMQDLFQSIYQKPNPKSGFTKERVGGQMAPRLDFGVIARHVLDTAHYATHAVAIRDVQKITTDPRFRQAVEAAWSRPVYEQIAPWLQNVARPAKEERTRMERLIARARRNVQIVAMGWKPFTAALQLTSLTSTAYKVGFWNTVRGVSALIAHPHDAAAFISERSIAVRNRKNSFDRDVVDMLGQFDPGKGGVLDRVHKTAFALIGMVDSAVAYATWQAAYTQAMEQNGWDEEKACVYADMQVRLSQGEGSAMSLAQVQHGNELRKFVTMFYSWFSANYNNIAEANRKAHGEGATLPSAVDLAKAYWWLLLAPAVLEQFLRHGPPDDEKEVRDMGVSVFGYFMSSFPLFRSMAVSMAEGRQFQISPIVDALESPTDIMNALQAKKDRGRKVAKTTLLGSGYLWGLPTRQAVTVMDAALDMAEGKTRNPLRFLVPAQKQGKKSTQRVSYGGN